LSHQLRGHRGVKIIRPGSTTKPVDTSKYPYKLEVILRQPDGVSFTTIYMSGGYERVIARGKSARLLLGFVERNNLVNHPRFKRYTILDSNGEIKSTFEK